MDGSDFDTLTRAIAQRGTRRWLVRLVATLPLGGVLAIVGARTRRGPAPHRSGAAAYPAAQPQAAQHQEQQQQEQQQGPEPGQDRAAATRKKSLPPTTICRPRLTRRVVPGSSLTLCPGTWALSAPLVIAKTPDAHRGRGGPEHPGWGECRPGAVDQAAGTTVTVQDLTITKGRVGPTTSQGGGIRNAGTLTLRDVSRDGQHRKLWAGGSPTMAR